MPDEAEKTQEEVKNLLSGMVEKVAGKEETQRSSFLAALIITGIAVIGFAIMGFLLMRARRKAALLASKLRLKKEEQAQAAENHKLAENGKARNEAHKKVKSLETEIQGLKDQMKALEEMNKERKATLSELTDWDDLVVIDKRKD
jgi:uncharacterized protein HemX